MTSQHSGETERYLLCMQRKMNRLYGRWDTVTHDSRTTMEYNRLLPETNFPIL
jgi:hypothetical protein